MTRNFLNLTKSTLVIMADANDQETEIMMVSQSKTEISTLPVDIKTVDATQQKKKKFHAFNASMSLISLLLSIFVSLIITQQWLFENNIFHGSAIIIISLLSILLRVSQTFICFRYQINLWNSNELSQIIKGNKVGTIAIVHIYVLLSTFGDCIFDVIQGYIIFIDLKYDVDADIFIFIGTWFGVCEEAVDLMEDALSLIVEECCLEICYKIGFKVFCSILLLMIITEQIISIHISMLVLLDVNLILFYTVMAINGSIICLSFCMTYILFFRFNIFERIVSSRITNHLIVAKNEITKLTSNKCYQFDYVILNENSVLTVDENSDPFLRVCAKQKLIMENGSKITVTGPLKSNEYDLFRNTHHFEDIAMVAGSRYNGGGVIDLKAKSIELNDNSVIESNSGIIKISAEEFQMADNSKITALSGKQNQENHGIIIIYSAKKGFDINMLSGNNITPMPYYEQCYDDYRLFSNIKNNGRKIELISGYEYKFDKTLILEENVLLTVARKQVGKLSLTINGDLIMQSGSKINLNGKGYSGGFGVSPGKSYKIDILDNGDWFAGGAGHQKTGSRYDQPDFGSGGGLVYGKTDRGFFEGRVYANKYGKYTQTHMGGSGGGVIELNINGKLEMNAGCEITANGECGITHEIKGSLFPTKPPRTAHGGGGSGGTIRIHCNDLIKNGSSHKICAVGGNGATSGCVVIEKNITQKKKQYLD
eukprot:25354_1